MGHTTSISEQTDRRAAILEVVGFASEKFLGPDCWDKHIEAVLMRLGKATRASRVIFYQIRREGGSETFMEGKYGWPSGADEETSAYRFDLKAEGLGKWLQALRKGDVVAGHAARFARRKQEAIARLGLTSSLMVGIVVDGNLWGMMRFDDCLAEQPWADGETEALKMAGNIVGAAIRQQQANEALAGERNLLHTLLEDMPDHFCVKDKHHVFIFANPACALVRGIENPKELIGRTDAEFFPPEGVEEEEREDDNIVATGLPILGQEIILQDVSGRDRYYENTKVPWRDDKGNIVGIIAASRDITERKIAEEALARERNLLRTLMDSLPDPIYVKDRKHRFVLANIACAQAHRCQTVEELIGKTDADRYQPDEVKVFHGDEDEIMASGQPMLHNEYLIKSAQKIDLWYLTTKVPWRDDKGNIIGIIGASRDITARKAAEELLQHRVELETLITSLSTRFINLSATAVDGAIDYALEQIGKFAEVDRCYVFQFADDSHTKWRNTHEWCADGIEPQVQTLQEVPLDSVPWWTDKMNRRKNVYIPRVAAMGPEAAAEKKIFQSANIQSLLGVPIASSAGLLGFVGFDSVRRERVWQEQDIAMLKELTNIFANALERRRAEQALRESEERHRTVFENAAEGIIITDLETKQFQYANPAACSMLGYTARKMTTMGIADIHRQEDLPHALSEFEAMGRSEKTLTTNLPCLRKDGTVMFADVSGAPIVISGRTYLAGFFTDTTQRKQSREKLEASLAEKEVLLREIHHRVKNNLQVISSLLTLHMQDVTPDQSEVLLECERQVHAIALIHDKLHQAESVAKVSFPEYVVSLAEDTRRSFGKRTENITCTVEAANVAIDIDRATPVGLILNELLSNAFKHAFPDGRKGEVTVRVFLTEKNMVCLSISDDGVGFPADFDLDNSTTLGLRLVSGLVRQLKGILEIDPAPPSTIRVTFPND